MSDTIPLKYPGLSKKQRATMGFHAFIVILIGSTAGFAWLLSLAEYLQFWPLPPLDLSVPDQKELWRNAHVGPIVHGMLIALIAAMSSILQLTKTETKIMVIASIIEVWGNAFGFQSAPFTSNRGLTPSGSFINQFAYFTFYAAVVAALIIIVLSIMGFYRTIKHSE